MFNSSFPTNDRPAAPSGEQVDLSAAVRRERLAFRRGQRKYAQFLSSCTEEFLGPAFAAEIRAAFEIPSPDLPVSSETGPGESEDQNLARERFGLKADTRLIRRRSRKLRRRLTRHLSRTKPEGGGACLNPISDDLASFSSEASDISSDSEEGEVTETSTLVTSKSSRDDDGGPPPSGGSSAQAVSAW